MARQHHTAEEIINKLREAEVGLANGLTLPEVSRKLGATRAHTQVPWVSSGGRSSTPWTSAVQGSMSGGWWKRTTTFC
jgi:hypothetical protein